MSLFFFAWVYVYRYDTERRSVVIFPFPVSHRRHRSVQDVTFIGIFPSATFELLLKCFLELTEIIISQLINRLKVYLFQKESIPSMHSSRMHTVRFSGCQGVSVQRGGLCPGVSVSVGPGRFCSQWKTPPPVNRMADTAFWKHYLAQKLICSRKLILTRMSSSRWTHSRCYWWQKGTPWNFLSPPII